MERKPLISIILPVYNVERYIARAVDSLINQSYDNLEIILVDDGSTDKSGSVCDALAKTDNRIRVFHKTNGGVSSARNVGLKQAQGDYIGFCDPDDVVHRDMFGSLLQSMLKNDCLCAVCKFRKFSDNDKISLTEELPTLKAKQLCGEDIISYFLSEGKSLLGSVWNKLFSRNLIDGLVFDEALALGEDYCFSLEALSRCERVAVLEQEFYYYYVREDSAMQRLNSEKYYLLFCKKEKLFEELRQQKLQDKTKAIIENAFLRGLAATFLNADESTRKLMKATAKRNAVKLIKCGELYWKERALFLITLIK